ncbi:MAG TPA: DUF2891 family protein [Albitalea sp.]|nr:DUF2891 family protein [Albitalea sp.]
MTTPASDPCALAPDQVRHWAECALAMVQRLYPHKLDHMILHEQDQPLPRDIHPVFSGCYDWHSSVHMHWSLLRLAALAPEAPWRHALEAHFDIHFIDAKVALERRYAAQPGRASFERPYGWAWLLKLQCELERQAQRAAPQSGVRRWSEALQPFADEVAARFLDFIGRSHYPVRAGTHANAAFAMLLAREHAWQRGDAASLAAIDAAARRWFEGDRAYPAAYEPGGTDFLSPGLCEALLMQHVLGASFGAWWDGFAPADLSPWLAPAIVSDRVDPQLVHLDGLNLSRAWCLRALAPALAPAQAARFEDAALAHWNAAAPHITQGDFAATHWLVSFALLALEAAG